MSVKIDMTPAVLDLVLYAGDVGDFQINFVDEFDGAIDVLNYGLQAQIRKSRLGTDHTDLELDLTHASLGQVIVRIPEEVTRDLVANAWDKKAQWDIQCTNPSVVTLVQGTVTCSQDVTR